MADNALKYLLLFVANMPRGFDRASPIFSTPRPLSIFGKSFDSRQLLALLMAGPLMTRSTDSKLKPFFHDRSGVTFSLVEQMQILDFKLND